MELMTVYYCKIAKTLNMSSVFLTFKVVKINMNKLILGMIFLMMIVVPMAYAKPGQLLVDKLDVKVDEKWDRRITDGDTITREAEPGSTVDFKIELKNNYTDAEDLRIEDITVTVTIEGIDDGEDIDEESNEFDIREDDDKTVTIKFKLPIEIEEDTYNVLIEAEGKDENGTDQMVVLNVDLEVEKEEQELRIYRKTLSPSEVKCGGIASLNFGLINTGSEDQEDVELIISNNDLEYNNVVTISDITADPYEDDSKYLKTYRIEIPETAEPGIYPLDITVNYDNGDEIIEEIVDITVSECEVVVEEPEEVVDEETGGDEDVVVVTQPPADTAPVVTQPIITGLATATEEKSFFESGTFIALLFGAEAIIVVIAILLVMMIVRKRKQ